MKPMHVITGKGKAELYRLIAEKNGQGYYRRGRVLKIDREYYCQIMIKRV
jgi:hypothetical protein